MLTFAILSVGWVFIGVNVYNIFTKEGSEHFLPSRDHARVVAVFWPIIPIITIGWLVYKALFIIPIETKKTVISIHKVATWSYDENKLLPAPKEIQEAMKEVETLLEGDSHGSS